jgi:nitrous oxidase accessory protein NosD
VLGNGGHGVEVQGDSQANINNSEIDGNRTGILAGASRADLSGDSISGNYEHGVVAQASAMVHVYDNTIEDNEGNGVFGYLGSAVVIGANEITRNATGVACLSDCTLQVSGANIHGNRQHAILVMLGSRLIFLEPVTNGTPNGPGWDDLWCGDGESSVDGADGLPSMAVITSKAA